MAHFMGKDQSTSTPAGKSQGASLAVLQLLALMRGEWNVQAPQSPFRVERMTAEERYCLGCCGVRWFDVIEGQRLAVSFQRLAICRCCGAEVEG
jgi:hypothetical protein